MDLDVLRDGYLTPLLDKISNQNKSISVPSDFNVDLLKYHYHTPTNEFLDSLSSHISLQYFIQTARVSSSCKTLIVSICSYILSPNPVLGNRSATILLHNSPLFPRSLCSSSNIYESDLTNFRNEKYTFWIHKTERVSFKKSSIQILKIKIFNTNNIETFNKKK